MITILIVTAGQFADAIPAATNRMDAAGPRSLIVATHPIEISWSSHQIILNARCDLGARQPEDRQGTPRRSRYTVHQRHGADLNSQQQPLHKVVLALAREPILPETVAYPQLLGLATWLPYEKGPSLR